MVIYKVLLLVQKRINGGKERDMDSLIAGGLGGWWCFGQRTPVSLVLGEYVWLLGGLQRKMSQVRSYGLTWIGGERSTSARCERTPIVSGATRDRPRSAPSPFLLPS